MPIPIFIVGSPRSGTTLLQCMLNAGGETFSLPETHFFCTILPNLKLSPDSALTEENLADVCLGIQQKMAFTFPAEIQADLEARAAQGDLTAAEVFLALIEQYRPAADPNQKLRLIEKTPYHIFHLDEILTLFPAARFIHLVRDPRDVVSSRLRMPTAPHQSPLLFAQDWARCLHAADDFARRHPDRLFTLRYEDLVARPEIGLQRACAFLGLDYQPQMRSDFSAQHAVCTLPDRETWKDEVKSGQIRNKSGVWRSRLTAEQAQIITTETREQMAAFGYLSDDPQEQVMAQNQPFSLSNPQVQQALAASAESIAQFKDKHRGQRCVIIGNGPSLNKMDLSFLKDEITFGMNRIYLGFEKWGFTPTYFVSVNTLVIEQSAAEIAAIPVPRFLSIYGLPSVADPGEHNFLMPVYGPLFSRDPAHQICEGYTVTYVALQLAHYMGFEEVYLIGVDHNFATPGPANQEIVSEGADLSHFDPNYFGKGVRWQLPDLVNSEVSYRLARTVFESEGRLVWDATVGGKLTIFPKADYRQIFFGEQPAPVADSAIPAEPDELPRVSVVVRDEGQTHRLTATLESLARQTHPNLEVILVNEGGLELDELLTPYSRNWPITEIIPDDQTGLSAARNLGLAQAEGEFVAFLEAGDAFHPDHLAAVASYLQGHTHLAAAYTDLTEILPENDQELDRVRSQEQITLTPLEMDKLLVSNPIPYSCLVYRKSALAEINGFDEGLDLLANWELLIRLAQAGELAHLQIDSVIRRWAADESAAYTPRDYAEAYQAIYQRYAQSASEEVRQAQRDFLAAFADYQTFSPDLGARPWPKGINALLQSANARVAEGDFAAALETFESLLTIVPSDPWFHVTHGNLLFKNNDSAGAQRAFEKALTLNPGDANAQASLGVALLNQGKQAEALAALEKACQLDPENADLRELLENLKSAGASPNSDPDSRIESAATPQSGESPRVTVIVSTYASEEFMRECLHDLVHQTILDQMEIIVVDANSPENEGEIVAEFQREYPQIRYLRTEARIGVYAAWNLAIRAGTAEFITPFSTNDRLRTDAYEILLRALEAHPEMALVYGNTYLTQTPHETFERHTRTGVFRWPDYSYESLLQHCEIGPHPMWRRAIHAEIGYFDEGYSAIGDQDFWLRIGELHPMLHIPAFTGLYWESPEALSQKGARPMQEIAEIQGKYQQRYIRRLQRMVAQAAGAADLDRARALFKSTFGFLPTTPVGQQALEALTQLEDRSKPNWKSPTFLTGENQEYPYLVSAIVSTYNSEAYLRACLEDLEAQTIADQLEIIVIDSGSPQNERAIVQEFQERYDNIVYLRTRRESLYTAWNRGIQMAKGKYITNANTDDAHRGDALEILAAALEAAPEAGLAYADYAWSSVPNDTFENPHAYRQIIHPPHQPAHAPFYCILGCHPMWRRETFSQIGLFDESYAVIGDYEFYLRFVAAGLRPVHVPEVLTLFYQNPEGLTYQSDRASQEILRLHETYRTGLPIHHLYEIDPDNPTEQALAWTAQGNLAVGCPVPWRDEPHQDLQYAFYCYQRALQARPDYAPALHNLITVQAHRKEWEQVEQWLQKLPPEHAQKLETDLQAGKFSLIPVELAPIVDPVAYRREDHLPTSDRAIANLKDYILHQRAEERDWPVDIVIPVYGQADLLERCVESVLATTQEAHLILVDDCSPGTEILDLFSRWEAHPRISLIQSQRNRGFIGTCKLGAELGAAPCILFLNSDVEAAETGWLDKLLPENPRIAITGAKLRYPETLPGPLAGTVQHAGVARNSDGIPYHPFLGWPADAPEVNEGRDVNAVTGACFLIRRAVWEELGGWDTRFGRGVYEDVDLCWRARQAGYRIRYQPAAWLYHHESASKTADGGHLLNEKTQENRQKLLAKWPKLASDEALFVGEKTAKGWQRARKVIARAQNRLDQNQFQAALNEMRQAASIAPDLPEALIGYAQLLSQNGEHERAAAYYRKAIQIAPAHWEARLQLIDESITAGQPEQAAAELAHLQAVFPANPQVTQRVEMLTLFLPPEESPDDSPARTLEMILAAEDILACLDQNIDKLDQPLYDLVRSNVQIARQDGQDDLASGLEDLAAYIEGVLAAA